ncbi:interleukin-8-like isoform X3 [Trematomus bernacchii]|uniref:interleukin-8-like isoform X3 n=1 Tax=Trematomus bernacchii TaxID=40690 RepID=UPI00146E1C99|nr:interleukin-8-like isoform X3 [Trematomus bernacchii]
MMTKAALLLSALTLCCCIASLQAFPRVRCMCIRTISSPMPVRVIKRIEVIPISGLCRRTEIIVTRRNGSKVCVNPAANWVNVLISNLQRRSSTP